MPMPMPTPTPTLMPIHSPPLPQPRSSVPLPPSTFQTKIRTCCRLLHSRTILNCLAMAVAMAMGMAMEVVHIVTASRQRNLVGPVIVVASGISCHNTIVRYANHHGMYRHNSSRGEGGGKQHHEDAGGPMLRTREVPDQPGEARGAHGCVWPVQLPNTFGQSGCL